MSDTASDKGGSSTNVAPYYVGKVYCSFCGGYDRLDGGSHDVMPFVFFGNGIPEGFVVSICPRCFVKAFEVILGIKAQPIEADACALDWGKAFKI